MPAASRRPSAAAPPPVQSIVVPVAGMTCRSCERRIERGIGRLPNVVGVSASATRGRVEIQAAGPVPMAHIEEAIGAAGYAVGRSPWIARDGGAWLTAGLGIIVVAGVAALAQLTGILGLQSGAADIASGGLLVALLLGLAAGVSTCAALTGGLVLALSASFAARAADAPGAGVVTRLRPSAVFVLGRIGGFAILGALLGVVGASFTLPPLVVAALMIAVAVLMTVLAVRLTGLSPRVAAWSPTLPSGLGRALGVDAGMAGGYSDTRAAVLGAATFFLPCGFTQAVQVYALSTGSPFTAGSIMAVFAIGTAPGLLALGGLPSLVPAGTRPALTRVIGVVVLAFALVNGMGGLRLAGLSPSMVIAGSATAPPKVVMEDGVQVLRTLQVADGYLPADASLYAGVPTRWIVESLEGRSCAVFLQVPSLGLSVTLQPGENTIDLPALEPGRVAYTCSMGMYGGVLTVVDAPVATPAVPVNG